MTLVEANHKTAMSELDSTNRYANQSQGITKDQVETGEEHQDCELISDDTTCTELRKNTHSESIDKALNSVTHYTKVIKDFVELSYKNPEESYHVSNGIFQNRENDGVINETLENPAGNQAIGRVMQNSENDGMSDGNLENSAEPSKVLNGIMQNQENEGMTSENDAETSRVIEGIMQSSENDELTNDSLENGIGVASYASPSSVSINGNLEAKNELEESKDCVSPTELCATVTSTEIPSNLLVENDCSSSSLNHGNVMLSEEPIIKKPESNGPDSNDIHCEVINHAANQDVKHQDTDHIVEPKSYENNVFPEHHARQSEIPQSFTSTYDSIRKSTDSIKVYVTPSYIQCSETGKRVSLNFDDSPSFPGSDLTISPVQMKNKRRRKVEELDPDTICGFGCFHPQCLQSWATSRAYLFLFSLLGILQGAYFSYLMTILSTIEKRYAFDSKVSGLVMMIDEITPLLLGVLIGYFGGKTHRPRMVGVGMFCSSLACLVSAFPYFIYGEAEHLMHINVRNTTETMFCNLQKQEDNCNEDNRESTTAAVTFFLVGSFLKGFGSLAYYAIGIAYMDDSAKKKNTPIYFAISSSLRLLGPTLGFFMSSIFLKYYEDPSVDPGYGPKDPRWVGAWWIGFVLQGALVFVVSLPMYLFPRRLPRQRIRALSNTANLKEETFAQTFLGLYSALKRLWKNIMYVLYSLGTIFSIMASFGYFFMMPRYMESQFRLSASQASLLSGPPGIIAFMASSIIGGLAIWKWKPNAKQLVAGILITEIISGLGYMVLMVPSCDNYTLPGTTSTADGKIELLNDCNAGCNCTTNAITPVCGPDGTSTYFSPCHAGCTAQDVFNETKTYHNCSCVYSTEGNLTFVESLSNGFCKDEDCWQQACAFVIITVILSAITGLFRVAGSMVLLRCVEPQDKSIALGLFETLLCGLAFMPYPILFGALVDSTCLVWEQSCDKTGNCWMYDVEQLRLQLHGISALITLLAVFCYTALYFYAGRIKNMYDDEPATPKPEELKNKPEKY